MTSPRMPERRREPRVPGPDGFVRYDAGEDVRCPGPWTDNSDRQVAARHGLAGQCAQFIMSVGPGTYVLVRVVRGRAFDERRHSPRGHLICPKCRSRLELEMSAFPGG